MPDQDGDEFVVSDPELIARVRAGDREAFGELYRRHAGPATTLARQFSRSAAESDDLVSESFARVLDNLLAGKGPDTAFRAYLFTTVRNTAYDRTRKDKRLQFTEDMSAHDVAVVGDDPVLANLESGMIATAFAKLPERWQAVLWHTQVEGESPAEVGALLGMAPGAVSSLAFRAREGLREAYLQAHLAETAAERCRTTVERLGAWTRGGLSKREKAQVDAHLEDCDRCRALAAELQEVNTGLRAMLAPLILGAAAAGYVATLGPVTPLAAAGTLWPGIAGAGAGAHAAGATGATGTGAGAAGTAAASGTTAGAAAGTTAGTTAGAAGTAAAAAASGSAALAATGGAGAAAAQTGAAGGSAAGTGGAAGATGATASGTGAAAASGTGAAAGATGAAAGTTAAAAGTTAAAAGTTAAAAGATAAAAAAGAAGAATGASGLVGALAGVSIVGWVAVGAVAAAAVIAAAVIAVSGSSSSTNSADQTAALTSPTSVTTIASQTEFTDDTFLSSGALALSASATATTPATATTAPTDTSVTDTRATEIPATTTSIADTSTTDTIAAVELSPAVLTPTDLTISQPLVAGGTGAFSVTVANSGQQDPGPNVPLEITLPAGVTVQSVDLTPGVSGLRRATNGYSLARAPAVCTPTADLRCSVPLGVVAPNATVIVTITVDVAPSVHSDTTATVTIFGVGLSTTIDSNQIEVGFSKLTASPGGPYFAPSTTSMTIAVTPKPGVTDPGPITLAIVGEHSRFIDPPSGCSTVGQDGTSQVTCNGPTITGLVLQIDADQPAGPLPLTVTDAGNRTIVLTDSTGTPLQVTPAPPAALGLKIQDGASLPAGGTGSISVTATNGGGMPTAAAPIHYQFPAGVTVADIDVDGIACATVEQDACTLPPVDPTTPGHPDTQRIVTFQLTAIPQATTGAATVTIAGQPSATTLTVETGIAALRASPDGPYLAPSTTSMTIAVTPKPGVTDPGPITLAIVGEHSRFIDAPSGCSAVGQDGTSQVTCNGPTITGLVLEIDADQPAGPLPLTVTDAGNRTIVLTDSTGTPLQVTPAPPAALGLKIQDGASLPAGGTGSISVTATNGGGMPTAAAPIHYQFPAGVTVADIDVDGIACATVEQDACTLPPVDPTTPGHPDTQRIVTFQLTAIPQATTGAATVTIAGQPSATTLTVETGIAALRASPDGPYLAPSTTVLDIAVTPVAGVTDPGPITLTLTGDHVSFRGSAGCTRSMTDPRHQLTCKRSPIRGLTLAISREQKAGLLPLTVTDAGGRDITAVLDNDLRVVAAPAALTITPIPAGVLYSGGTGSASFTVTNHGALRSAAAPISFTPPTGVEVTSVQTGGRSCVAVPWRPCLLPPIGAESSTTVLVNLTATPKATGGVLTVNAGGASGFTLLVVRSGVTGVAVSPSSPYLAPSTTKLTIQVGYQKVVTNPGTLTLTLTGGVTFTAVPRGCSHAGQDDRFAPPTQRVTCGGGTIRGLEMTIDKSQPVGLLPLTATDEAGRHVDVKDDKGDDLEVVPAPPTHPALSEPQAADPTTVGLPGGLEPTVTTPNTTPPTIPNTAPPNTGPPAALGWQVTDTGGPLRAGGAASATVAITNTGDQPSQPQILHATPPPGIAISAITAGDGSLCTLGDQTCTLPPVSPGATTTVTVTVTAAPDAHSGSLVLTSGDQRIEVPLTVDGGLQSVTAKVRDTLVRGSNATLEVAATAYPGVTDLGRYQLALHTDQAWFAGYPATCQALTSRPTEITCTGAAIDGLQLTLTGDQPAGSLPLFAVDAGGRSMPVTDVNGAPLVVVEPTAATAQTPAEATPSASTPNTPTPSTPAPSAPTPNTPAPNTPTPSTAPGSTEPPAVPSTSPGTPPIVPTTVSSATH